MATAYRDLTIPGGGTIEFVVDVLGGPDSLAGYVGTLKIRELRNLEEVIGEIGESNITVNSLTRQVTVRIPSEITEPWDWTRGVYDLIITGPSEDVWQLVEGRAILTRIVSRED